MHNFIRQRTNYKPHLVNCLQVTPRSASDKARLCCAAIFIHQLHNQLNSIPVKAALLSANQPRTMKKSFSSCFWAFCIFLVFLGLKWDTISLAKRTVVGLVCRPRRRWCSCCPAPNWAHGTSWWKSRLSGRMPQAPWMWPEQGRRVFLIGLSEPECCYLKAGSQASKMGPRSFRIQGVHFPVLQIDFTSLHLQSKPSISWSVPTCFRGRNTRSWVNWESKHKHGL
jgi:hypothetical protein